MRFDYSAMGFHTYDCLGWPISAIPPGGDTFFIEELTLAVSGAAGAAAVAAATVGLKTQAVGGVGADLMGDWVLERFQAFDIDVSQMSRHADTPTSSSIVLTRSDGSRPALHLRGATAAFEVAPDRFDAVTDAKVFHLGGVGLMDAMDGERNAALMAHAKARGCITTIDVFAGSKADLPDVEAVLPYTDYFIPSIEEARALSGLAELSGMVQFFFDKGAACCVFTLGSEGAYYHHRDGTHFRMPAFEIDVKCTCGCGDVFDAGIATGIVHGMTPQEAVRFAQAMSALNATGLGSQGGIRSLDQVRDFMNSCSTKSPSNLAATA